MSEPDVSGFLETTMRNAAGRTWQSAYLEAEEKVKTLQAEMEALRKELDLTINERDAAFLELDRVMLAVVEKKP